MKAIVTFELYEEIKESFDFSPYASMDAFLSDFDIVQGGEGTLGERHLRILAVLARLGGEGRGINYIILRDHFLEEDREAGYSEGDFQQDIHFLHGLDLTDLQGAKVYPRNGYGRLVLDPGLTTELLSDPDTGFQDSVPADWLQSFFSPLPFQGSGLSDQEYRESLQATVPQSFSPLPLALPLSPPMLGQVVNFGVIGGQDQEVGSALAFPAQTEDQGPDSGSGTPLSAAPGDSSGQESVGVVAGRKRRRTESTESEEKAGRAFNSKRILTELAALRGDTQAIRTELAEMKSQINALSQQIQALPGARAGVFRPLPSTPLSLGGGLSLTSMAPQPSQRSIVSADSAFTQTFRR